MARVNLDGKVWKDPKVRRLALACHWSMRETVGTLAAIWDVAYDAKSDMMESCDIDTIAELEGFGRSMVACGLADDHGGAVRLHGVLERIQYLLKQAERGKAGGLAKAKHTLSGTEASAKRPPSLPLAPDLPLPPDLPRSPPNPLLPESAAPASPPLVGLTPTSGKVRKPKKQEYTSEEMASCARILERVSDRSGISYRGSNTHHELMVARLREGKTELELRSVVAYCADPRANGGLGWQDNPDMRVYLRPETLFGKKNIEKYLDAALTWARQKHPHLFAGRQPALKIVTEQDKPSELVTSLMRRVE